MYAIKYSIINTLCFYFLFLVAMLWNELILRVLPVLECFIRLTSKNYKMCFVLFKKFKIYAFVYEYTYVYTYTGSFEVVAHCINLYFSRKI